MRRKLELYFHIPFCVSKCYYCDFLSAPADDATKRDYMEALLTETVGSAEQYQEYEVISVFIGGGTPSVVNVEYIERLLQVTRDKYPLSDDAEITMEVNPGTVNEEKLLRYRKAGINRLSIGMQSANNNELKSIGRIHTWEQFAETFRVARAVGYCNINVDVMSALPGQSLESYEETLCKVLALENPPEHISAYSLILEEGTRFYEKYERDELILPDEDEDREMYCATKSLLERRGYYRYEISNYAKPGYECRHNCGYWKRTDYVGFGIGAASFVRNERFQNGCDILEYIFHPMECKEERQKLTVREQMEEFLFLGLRMTKGVSLREFEKEFGVKLMEVYGEVIAKNIREGLLRVGRKRLMLTEKGLDVSNYVMAQFLE